LAFDSSFPRAVGFLLGEEQRAGGADLEPLGTFFVLQIQRDSDTFAAMVTSRHVVADQSLVIARLQDGSGAPIEWDASGWIFPADDRSDWAVRPSEPPTTAHGAFPGSFPATRSLVQRPVESDLGQVQTDDPVIRLHSVSP
jgi:hypothetical protein